MAKPGYVFKCSAAEYQVSKAESEALEQLRLLMKSATKRVRTSSGVREVPDWPTRLKACRLARS